MRISDWSSDVCSSDLHSQEVVRIGHQIFERISGACADSSDSLVSFLENRCSKRGVYRSELLDFIGNFGASDRIRTCDPCLRRAVLYPAELRMREASSPKIGGASGRERWWPDV